MSESSENNAANFEIPFVASVVVAAFVAFMTLVIIKKYVPF